MLFEVDAPETIAITASDAGAEWLVAMLLNRNASGLRRATS
jgi:hypothetical protein